MILRKGKDLVILLTVFSVFFGCGGLGVSAEERMKSGLHSLEPENILEKLDLSREGLESVKQAADRGDRSAALAELLQHYRRRFPLQKKKGRPSRGTIERADQIVKHIFQWRPYEPADYGRADDGSADDGREINWEWDPRGDIEWVAAIYRFYWAPPLANAFASTRDNKYAKAFVDLTADWIAKHPLENHTKTHPVYTHWRGFAWLDIQTGIRATQICQVFPTFVHAESFTPEFLGIVLASLYDHQVKTEEIPMNKIHNKAVFEQRGFVNIAFTFPEFRDSKRWLQLAMERTTENLLAQTTTDGVQREWSGGYHSGVLRDAVEIMERMESVGIDIPAEYRERVRGMYDYIFWIATPHLDFPMFGDTSRKASSGKDRTGLKLYGTLLEGSRVTGDPLYEARARLIEEDLPKETSHAFSDAGMYTLRDRWGPDQIYLALHCSPKALTSHDQPDNGTFELCAYGRWLMPDSGYYFYGHNPEGRAWHRRTSVHQTLTLDGRDTQVDGRELLWTTTPELDALVVENPSYENLTHRRSVWFVDKSFFVVLDEAIGSASGVLDLHFQLAPGDALSNADENWFRTSFEDTNVLVWSGADAPVILEEEEGWHAWEYGKRASRPAFRFRHENSAPASFLTLVVPYRGGDPPDVSIYAPEDFVVGGNRVSFQVSALEKTWSLGRDLENGTAWCQEVGQTQPGKAPGQRR
jgi:heparan-sulfate lyase